MIHRCAANDRPNPIAVSLRLLKSLQNDHPASFPPHVAVGGRVERLALAVRRQHHRIRTEFVDAAVQNGVHTACNSQIRLALLEVCDCVVY